MRLRCVDYAMTTTVAYYNDHAASFFADTVNVDMAELQARFLANVPAGGLVLDAGCGSGRDSRAFMVQGFRVRAFDASAELAQLASDLIGKLLRPGLLTRLTRQRATTGFGPARACCTFANMRCPLHLSGCGRPSSQRVLSI